MALQKLHTLGNGTSGDYFKITRIIVDKNQMKMVCQLELFLDEAHATSEPMGFRKIFHFDVTDEELTGDIVALGYNKITAYANQVVSVGDNGSPDILQDADIAGAVSVLEIDIIQDPVGPAEIIP